MDVALAIFNVGAGIGVLAAGGALVYLAWQMTPLIKESRALTADLRRLTRVADAELRPILANTKELTSNVEVLSEDVAVKLDRLGDLMNAHPAGSRSRPDHGRCRTAGAAAGRIVGNARGRIGLMKDSGFGSFLAGVVIGGLIGAALGLLLAPQTGDEFRDHVGEFVDGKRAEWEDAVNEGKAAAESARAGMVSEFDAAEGQAL